MNSKTVEVVRCCADPPPVVRCSGQIDTMGVASRADVYEGQVRRGHLLEVRFVAVALAKRGFPIIAWTRAGQVGAVLGPGIDPGRETVDNLSQTPLGRASMGTGGKILRSCTRQRGLAVGNPPLAHLCLGYSTERTSSGPPVMSSGHQEMPRKAGEVLYGGEGNAEHWAFGAPRDSYPLPRHRFSQFCFCSHFVC
jgi:hypothetical protein